MQNERPNIEARSISTIGGFDKAALFERTVASKGGKKKIILPEAQAEQVIKILLRNSHFVELVNSYTSGLKSPDSFSESDEINLRQKIFPIIDVQMREIDPTYSIFSAGILEVIVATMENGN